MFTLSTLENGNVQVIVDGEVRAIYENMFQYGHAKRLYAQRKFCEKMYPNEDKDVLNVKAIEFLKGMKQKEIAEYKKATIRLAQKAIDLNLIKRDILEQYNPEVMRYADVRVMRSKLIGILKQAA